MRLEPIGCLGARPSPHWAVTTAVYPLRRSLHRSTGCSTRPVPGRARLLASSTGIVVRNEQRAAGCYITRSAVQPARGMPLSAQGRVFVSSVCCMNQVAASCTVSGCVVLMSLALRHRGVREVRVVLCYMSTRHIGCPSMLVGLGQGAQGE